MNEIESIKDRIENGYTMTRYGSHKAMVEQLISDTKYLLSQVDDSYVLDLVIWRCNKSLYMNGERVFTYGHEYKQTKKGDLGAIDDEGDYHGFGKWEQHFIAI